MTYLRSYVNKKLRNHPHGNTPAISPYLLGPATCLVNEVPGSSTSGPTGNDWLDLTTRHPIEKRQEAIGARAITEGRGEAFKPVISVFSDGDVVDLQPLEDLPEQDTRSFAVETEGALAPKGRSNSLFLISASSAFALARIAASPSARRCGRLKPVIPLLPIYMITNLRPDRCLPPD